MDKEDYRFLILLVTVPALLIALGIFYSTKKYLSSKPTNSAEINRMPSLVEDFIMGSPTAVSNAMFFNQPPTGWDIVCDDIGHYCPRVGGMVVQISNAGVTTVRTSRLESVIAAWRMKEIWDTPKPASANYKWRECDEY